MIRQIPWYLTLKYQRQWQSKKTIETPPPKKILILGSKGMLGHIVYDLAARNQWVHYDDIYGACKENDGDLADEQNFVNLLDKIKPDYVVNCVGKLVKDSIENHFAALKANTVLPWMGLHYSIPYKYKFIHVSTDCVFKGKKQASQPGFYKRNSFKDAESWYGITKGLGELITWGDDPGEDFLEYRKHFLTIRTSIIGPEIKENGTGLFHWAMRYKEPVISGYSVLWNGVTTYTLARFIIKEGYKPEYGILRHFTSPIISKYRLVEMIGDMYNRSWFAIEKPDTGKGAKLLAPSVLLHSHSKSMREQLKEMRTYMHNSPNAPIYEKLYGAY